MWMPKTELWFSGRPESTFSPGPLFLPYYYNVFKDNVGKKSQISYRHSSSFILGSHIPQKYVTSNNKDIENIGKVETLSNTNK